MHPSTSSSLRSRINLWLCYGQYLRIFSTEERCQVICSWRREELRGTQLHHFVGFNGTWNCSMLLFFWLIKESKDINVMFSTIVGLSISGNMKLVCCSCFGDSSNLFSIVLYANYRSSIWIYGGIGEHSSCSRCYLDSSSLCLHFFKDWAILLLASIIKVSYVLTFLLMVGYHYWVWRMKRTFPKHE